MSQTGLSKQSVLSSLVKILRESQSVVPSVFTKISSGKGKHRIKSFSSAIFILHCQATVLLLCVGLTVLGYREYFGEGVLCQFKPGNLFDNIEVNEFCFFHGTFTAPIRFPGIFSNAEHAKHTYYQWVYFLLFFQLLLFALPEMIWKKTEKHLTAAALKLAEYCHDAEQNRGLPQEALDCLFVGSSYWKKFVYYNLLCLLNLLLQIFIVDILLGNKFITLGLIYLAYLKEDRVIFELNKHQIYAPLNDVFPLWASCHMSHTGFGGEAENREAICFLPLNNVNAKIFLWMWFWFSFLLISTSLLLIAQLCETSNSALRFKKLKRVGPTCSSEILRKFAKDKGYTFVLYVYAEMLGATRFVAALYGINKHFVKSLNGVCKPIEDVYDFSGVVTSSASAALDDTILKSEALPFYWNANPSAPQEEDEKEQNRKDNIPVQLRNYRKFDRNSGFNLKDGEDQNSPV